MKDGLSNEAEVIAELDGMLNGLANVERRARDYRLLMALGFSPMAAHPGLGVFHEWYREVDKNGSKICVDVVLLERSVIATIATRPTSLRQPMGPRGQAEASSVAEALRNALSNAGFRSSPGDAAH